MFRFCLCGDPKPLNSCCQASTDRSGHSGDLAIHSCPEALLESTLNFLQNTAFGKPVTYPSSAKLIQDLFLARLIPNIAGDV